MSEAAPIISLAFISDRIHLAYRSTPVTHGFFGSSALVANQTTLNV